MEVIRELITCKFCEHRLIDPIVLPCGETICAEHAHPDSSYVKCMLCQNLHEIPEKGFPRNKSIARSLEMGIDRVMYGKGYSIAIESIGKLRSAIESYNEVKNNKELFIYEFFEHLRNKIDAFCEQHKVSFDKMIVEEIRTNLKDYETACKTNLSRSHFDSVVDAMEELSSLSKTLGASSTSDDRLWRQIDVKARKKRDEVNVKLDELKHQLLLNKSNKFIVQNFSQIQKNYGDFDLFRLDDTKKIAELTRKLYTGNYSLQSLYNKKYMCAPDRGQKPLVTYRERRIYDDAEAFRFVALENGLTGIQSLSNQNYVLCNLSFELLASATQVEFVNHRFEIVFAFHDTDIIGIRSAANGKYVSVERGIGRPVLALATTFGESEMFKLKKWEKRSD